MLSNPNRLSFNARSGAFRSTVSYRAMVLAGAAIVISLTGPAHAANFTVSNEAELVNAINQANASGDASSTITLSNGFVLSGLPLPQVTKNLKINGGGYEVTSAKNIVFDVAAGANLDYSGVIRTNGTTGFSGSMIKTGDGTMTVSGGAGTYNWYLTNEAGNLIIKDGAQVTYTGGSNLNPTISKGSGSVTISGAGTVVNGNGGLKLGSAEGAVLNIEDGGKYLSGTLIGLASAKSDTAVLNVTGAGSLLEGPVRVEQGSAVINVRDGGQISGSAVHIGVIANYVNADGVGQFDRGGSADILVSDAGSRWDVDFPFILLRGSLNILNGGVVQSGSMRIGFFDKTLTKDAEADVLVSGAGSELITTDNRKDGFAIGGGSGKFDKKGTLTINNGGAVTVGGGTGTIDLAKTASSEGAINIGGAAGQTAAKAGALSAGKIQFGAGDGTLNFNHIESNYDFGIELAGSGTITHSGSGKTTLTTDQAGFAGQTKVQSGTLAVDHILGGTMDVSGGRLQGIGTVGSTVLNAGGVIAAGNTSLGTLTIDADYTGKGGLLEIRTVLGDDSSATDKLVITGNSSGDTNVKVTNRNGLGAQTDKGIRIIEVGGQSDGNFSLVSDYTTKDGKKVVIGGAYAYELVKNAKSDPADGDWYLVSEVYQADPVDDGNVTTPRYSAAVPVYQGYMSTLQSLNKLPTLQQRVGERYGDGLSTSAPQQNNGENRAVWGRIEGAHNHFRNNSSLGRLQQDINTYILQSGVDGQFYESDNGKLIGGLTGQYGNAQNNVSAFAGDGTIKTQNWGLGGTLTWYGSNGFYADGQAQANWYDSDLKIDNANSLANGHHAFGYALSIEAGQKLALNDIWSLTPQAQLMWSSLDFNTFRDSYDTQVEKNNGDSLTARLGLAANYRNDWKTDDGRTVNTQFYGIANLYQELSGSSKINVADVKLANDEDRTWAGLGAGGTYAWGDNAYAVYGEGSVNTSLNHFADSYVVKGTVGFKMKW